MTDQLFFDTDCLSAFLWINDTNILHELYGGKIVLPEPVYQELSNPSIPHIKQRADVMISSNDVSVKTIDTGTEEYDLYAELVRGKRARKVSVVVKLGELHWLKPIMEFLQVTTTMILLYILRSII